MPKRSLDVTDSMMLQTERKVQKKTERSHEENQERAYIAASRRADRSIEARVQSARMASEIHKKRTGKGFKISEEIVMKEEMYEEEEDDLPRHYRVLSAHLRTGSAEMNSRVNAYLTSQVAMAAWQHEQEVNRMFAESFPGMANYANQLTQSPYVQALHSSSPSPTFPSLSEPPFDRGRSHSLPQSSAALLPQTLRAFTQQADGQFSRHGSFDGYVSPPALTPGTETPQSRSTPTFSYASPSHIGHGMPVDPSLTMSYQSNSPFTSELAPEAKLMVNLEPHDALSGVMMGNSQMYHFDAAPEPRVPADTQMAVLSRKEMVLPAYNPQDFVHAAAQPIVADSRIGSPGGGVGDDWKQWIHPEHWATQPVDG